MEIGQRVEVHTHYDGTWSSGFEIAAVVDDGYLLRRRSDGCLLPVAMSESEVRAVAHAAERGQPSRSSAATGLLSRFPI